MSNVNIIERRAYRDGASSTGMRKAFRGGWWARLAVLVPLVLAAGAKKNVLLITLDAFSGRDPWLQGVKTPNLDAIEHRGTRSATAASASLTLPMPSDPHTAHAPTPPRRGWGRNRSWWFLTHRRPWFRSWSTSAGWSRPGPCAHRFARAVRPGSSMLPHQVPEPVQSIYLFRESLPTRMPVFPPPFSQAQPVLGGRGGCWDTPRVLYRTTSSVRWRSR